MAVLGAVVGVGVLAACGTAGTGEGAAAVMRGLGKPPAAMLPEAPPPRLVAVSRDGAGSSLALARLGDRRLAVVADADADAVRMFDTRTDEEMPQLDLGGAPSQLVVAGDGRIFVALRDRAEVDVLEATAEARPSLRVTGRVATAEEPTALALTPDGRTLLVACGWGHELDAFSTRTLEAAFRADVGREPRAVVTSADGKLAYVAHATASVVSVVDLASPDHAVRAQRMEQPNPNGDAVDVRGRAVARDLAWRQGFALARADMGILAPGVEANTGDTTVRTETYGGVDETSMPAEQFSVAVLDEPPPKDKDGAAPALAAAPSDVPRAVDGSFSQCLLPRAAAYDGEGDWLLVACAGKNTVLRMDVHTRRGAGQFAEWKVGAEPTGLALDEEHRTAFVWSQGARTVTSVPIDAFHPSAESTVDSELSHVVALGERVALPDAVARGRALFHTTGDARISSDGRACASCHPDGRDDGLVWATPDGPRQTPMLAGRLAGTAPYGWNGARSSVKAHVKGTLKRLGGTGLPDADMNALIAYCMSMKPPPRAALTAAAPRDEARVAEGRDLFESESAGCSSCHIQDGTFTDGNRHDVRSRAKGDPHKTFDTPSLRFVASTAPYFHDGRYPTLRALLLGSDGRMGHTRQLSDDELTALQAYLETL